MEPIRAQGHSLGAQERDEWTSRDQKMGSTLADGYASFFEQREVEDVYGATYLPHWPAPRARLRLVGEGEELTHTNQPSDYADAMDTATNALLEVGLEVEPPLGDEVWIGLRRLIVGICGGTAAMAAAAVLAAFEVVVPLAWLSLLIMGAGLTLTGVVFLLDVRKVAAKYCLVPVRKPWVDGSRRQVAPQN